MCIRLKEEKKSVAGVSDFARYARIVIAKTMTEWFSKNRLAGVYSLGVSLAKFQCDPEARFKTRPLDVLNCRHGLCCSFLDEGMIDWRSLWQRRHPDVRGLIHPNAESGLEERFLNGAQDSQRPDGCGINRTHCRVCDLARSAASKTSLDAGEGCGAADDGPPNSRTRSVTAFLPICPHLGCGYRWDDGDHHFRCPCRSSL